MHIFFEVVQVGRQVLGELAMLQGHKAGLPVPVTICDRSCGHMCQMPLSQHLLIKVALAADIPAMHLRTRPSKRPDNEPKLAKLPD